MPSEEFLKYNEMDIARGLVDLDRISTTLCHQSYACDFGNYRFMEHDDFEAIEHLLTFAKDFDLLKWKKKACMWFAGAIFSVSKNLGMMNELAFIMAMVHSIPVKQVELKQKGTRIAEKKAPLVTFLMTTEKQKAHQLMLKDIESKKEKENKDDKPKEAKK